MTTTNPTTGRLGIGFAGPLDVRARDLFDRSIRAHLLAADERWGAAAGGWTASLLVAVIAAFAVLLGTSGLGMRRTVAAEALLLGFAGTLLALVRAPLSLRRRPSLRSFVEDAHFASLLGAVTCTGGLQSPLLLALLTVTPARVLSGGWSRRTRTHVLLVCGAALAMAVVPDGWLGPPLPPRAYTGIAALALASGVLLHSHYIGFLWRTVEESVWDAVQAREQVAAQALARTRELEQLGARLSHELKNPLAAIKALAQLAGRAATDPDGREALDTIASESERMRHVVDEYLSFSRPLEKLRLEPVSVGDLAEEVLAVLAGRADEAGVALEASGDAVAVADPRRLKDALLNLVANALEATPPGGRVRAVVSTQGALARVTVTDTGVGMTPEVLTRIGTPFYTTRESGTGLGVLLARTVLKQHGGGLTYESAPGAGTVAVASLAIAGPERSDSHAEAAVRG